MKLLVGKVVVLGYQGVGKTSTVVRFVDNSYSTHIAPTIGASFFTCKMNIDGVQVKLQIWDTAGQERFKAMTPMFYRNANAAILVYDITSPESYEQMKGWVIELQRNIEEPIVLCVVGNKIDLMDKRKVPREEAQQYASTIGARYFECSAKEDQGVGVIFESIAHGLLKLYGAHVQTSLKVYDSDNIGAIMARSTTETPTDIGQEENVNVSINSIAHGRSVRTCC